MTHEGEGAASMTPAEVAAPGEPRDVPANGPTKDQIDDAPGMDVKRLVRLARQSVIDMRIDLGDAVVVTEAATGAYAVTPVIAAMAGARHVYGFTRATRYGSVEEVERQTRALAAEAGVLDRIEVRTDRPLAVVGSADVITNSGHVRPIDREMIRQMRPTVALPLMFESWEIQAGRFDLALDDALARGIRIAGTNERHPMVDVFSYLGTMAVKLLFDAGTAVRNTRIVLACDNPFASYMEAGLSAAGAVVRTTTSITDSTADFDPDYVLVALTPTGSSVLSPADVRWIATRWPAAVVVQFWGDLDRTSLQDAGVLYWPLQAPPAGHMAILPNDPGPEPVVRLQAGGLKVASVLLRSPADRSAFDLEFLDEL
jgi:hypothetical protein